MIGPTRRALSQLRILTTMISVGVIAITGIAFSIEVLPDHYHSLVSFLPATLFLVFGSGLLGLLHYLRRSVRELDQERVQLEAVYEALIEGVVIHDAQGAIVRCNRQASDILGLPREQLLGKTCMNHHWQAVREDGTPWPGEEHPTMITLRTGQSLRDAVMGIRNAGGDKRWLAINTQAILDDLGQPTTVVTSFADVTSMRQQVDRLDLTITGAGLGTWDWNIVTGEVVFNDIWASMLGYQLSEVEPNVRSWEKIVDPAAARSIMSALDEHLAGKTAMYRSEHRLRRKDGSWMWVLDAGRVVERDAEGKPLRALGVHVDITATKEMEEQLNLAQDRLVQATRNARLGVWDWNPQTDEAWFGEQYFAMLGYQGHDFEHTGATWLKLLHPQDLPMATKELGRYLDGDLAHQDTEFRLEFRMRHRDGSWRWILSVGRVTERDHEGRPRRVSGVHFDETDRKRMQSQRAQAQRLESIGQLAAGVAHEINTPMQFVSDNLEYLVEGIQSADRVIATLEQLVASAKEDGIQDTLDAAWLPKTLKETGYARFRKESAGAVRDCRDGCKRVVTIVQAMRQLSHPSNDGFHTADLNEIIQGATIVTRNHWKFVADVRLDLAPDLPSLPCRAAELSQVFVNMLVNAADALESPSGETAPISGVIVLRTERIEDHIRIQIQDNGSGIPANVIERIFDPFFTTKPVGKGTGQGLAIAHDIIVNRHNGILRVESEPGKGTTFVIDLPLAQEVAATV